MRVIVEPDPAALSAALALRERVFVGEQGVPLDLEHDEHDATAHHVVLFAENHGEAVATGRVRLVGDGVAKVERVAVDATHRGTGLGRRVMDALEARARDLGASVARLAAQESAIGFYQRLGYRGFGERFWEAGLAHKWMDKPLA